jgi:intracellular sulfur oxidation DsrE/DsrF family protein
MNNQALISDEPVFPHIEKYGVVYPYPAHINKFPEDVTRKIVFSVTKPASRIDFVNPGLHSIARLLNIYEYEHISYKRYNIAAVIYGEAISSVLSNYHYRERYFIENPNIELIECLKDARVRLYACWQSLQDYKYNENMILDNIEITNCAMNALSYYQQNHYMLMPL